MIPPKLRADLPLYVRRAGLTILENDSAVTGYVSGRVYGPRTPQDVLWPFIRWGTSDATQFVATGHSGLQDEVMIHCFSDGADESEALLINGAVSLALDNVVAVLPSPYPAKATFSAIGSRVIPDAAEADKWHGIVRLRWACPTG